MVLKQKEPGLHPEHWEQQAAALPSPSWVQAPPLPWATASVPGLGAHGQTCLDLLPQGLMGLPAALTWWSWCSLFQPDSLSIGRGRVPIKG